MGQFDGESDLVKVEGYLSGHIAYHTVDIMIRREGLKVKVYRGLNRAYNSNEASNTQKINNAEVEAALSIYGTGSGLSTTPEVDKFKNGSLGDIADLEAPQVFDSVIWISRQSWAVLSDVLTGEFEEDEVVFSKDDRLKVGDIIRVKRPLDSKSLAVRIVNKDTLGQSQDICYRMTVIKFMDDPEAYL